MENPIPTLCINLRGYCGLHVTYPYGLYAFVRSSRFGPDLFHSVGGLSPPSFSYSSTDISLELSNLLVACSVSSAPSVIPPSARSSFSFASENCVSNPSPIAHRVTTRSPFSVPRISRYRLVPAASYNVWRLAACSGQRLRIYHANVYLPRWDRRLYYQKRNIKVDSNPGRRSVNAKATLEKR